MLKMLQPNPSQNYTWEKLVSPSQNDLFYWKICDTCASKRMRGSHVPQFLTCILSDYRLTTQRMNCSELWWAYRNKPIKTATQRLMKERKKKKMGKKESVSVVATGTYCLCMSLFDRHFFGRFSVVFRVVGMLTYVGWPNSQTHMYTKPSIKRIYVYIYIFMFIFMCWSIFLFSVCLSVCV